jgi:hypothetical protein
MREGACGALLQQPVLHGTKPGSHAIAHFSAAHVAEPFAVVGQVLVQSPQCCSSVETSTQDCPHLVKGAVQLSAHPVGPQTSDAAH